MTWATAVSALAILAITAIVARLYTDAVRRRCRASLEQELTSTLQALKDAQHDHPDNLALHRRLRADALRLRRELDSL